jgi:hypothetical protein
MIMKTVANHTTTNISSHQTVSHGSVGCTTPKKQAAPVLLEQLPEHEQHECPSSQECESDSPTGLPSFPIPSQGGAEHIG